jgi:predicted dehydrogenase
MGLAGGVQAVARFHNLPQADNRYDGVDVIGTKGSLAVRGGFVKRLYRRQGHTFADNDRWQPVELPAAYVDTLTLDDNGASTYLCQQMILELVAAVETGRPHVASGRDGLIALELLMATYHSHLAHAPVTLPLAERRHPLELLYVAKGDD